MGGLQRLSLAVRLLQLVDVELASHPWREHVCFRSLEQVQIFHWLYEQEVRLQMTTVLIRLLLKTSFWTTT